MKIIYTDLDGTLLDYETYSFYDAKKALDLIKEKKIILVICTSKTAAEIEYWRKKIDNVHPFISENGGGIFIPKNYFPFEFEYQKETVDYFVIELGTNIDYLSLIFDKLKDSYQIESFIDMTIEDVANDSNITLDQAILAKERNYDLPFKIINKDQENDILNEIKENNLQYTIGGRYYHLMGNNDKGKAINILLNLYKEKYSKDIISIGIGDSDNDFSMLEVVDKAYLVKKRDGSYASSKYKKAEDIGPAGWNQVVMKELSK